MAAEQKLIGGYRLDVSKLRDDLKDLQKYLDMATTIVEKTNNKGVVTVTAKGITEAGDAYIQTFKKINDAVTDVTRSITKIPHALQDALSSRKAIRFTELEKVRQEAVKIKIELAG